jgi:hypothetical protein
MAVFWELAAVVHVAAEDDSPEARERIVEASRRYWQAHTRGWSTEKHGCVSLLAALDQVKRNAVSLQLLAALLRQQRGHGLPGDESLLAQMPTGFVTRVSPIVTLMGNDFFRDTEGEFIQHERFDEIQAVRRMFGFEYPVQARALADLDIKRALAVWTRPGGRPRSSTKEDAKWPFLASLCERLFGRKLSPDTLHAYWREWKGEKR